ncbi:MAG: nucleotidyltransferase domain-containing protein [Patescibacteria group bacterium]
MGVLRELNFHRLFMTKQKLQKNLKQIIKDLKPYKPEKIILYGSCARGDFREDSDIDLLIIKETKKDFFSRINDVGRLVSHKIPMDILIFTPEEVKKRLDLKDFFFEEMIQKGKIIYG